MNEKTVTDLMRGDYCKLALVVVVVRLSALYPVQLDVGRQFKLLDQPLAQRCTMQSLLTVNGDNVKVMFLQAHRKKTQLTSRGQKGHDADYGPNGKKGVKLVTRLRPMVEYSGCGRCCTWEACRDLRFGYELCFY
jgi:hypothetical protein